jgi:hypothetical protein
VLELQADGGRGASAQIIAQVNAALSVDFFDVQPAALMRYVVQTVTVSWNAPGAVTTRVTGLESFTSQLVQGAYGASGTISLAGVPSGADLELTLIASSADGRSVEQALKLPVQDPICRAGSSGLTVYGAPGLGNAIIGTAGPGARFVVDAQDTGGSWLRITPEGGLPGWAERSRLVCESSFLVDALRKEVVLPAQEVPPPNDRVPAPTDATPAPSSSAAPGNAATEIIAPEPSSLTPTAVG